MLFIIVLLWAVIVKIMSPQMCFLINIAKIDQNVVSGVNFEMAVNLTIFTQK